jgi:hypothetical protein
MSVVFFALSTRRQGHIKCHVRFAFEPISPCRLCLSGYCGGRDFLPPPDPLPLTKADWIGPSITEACIRRRQLSLVFLLLEFEHHRVDQGARESKQFSLDSDILDTSVLNHTDGLHEGTLRLSSTPWSHPAHTTIHRSRLVTRDWYIPTASLELARISDHHTAKHCQ